MHKILISGLNKQKWMSVNKTQNFYMHSLNKHFQVYLRNEDVLECDIDIAMNFSGDYFWKNNLNPHVMKVIVMHGGLVLDQKFLREYLPTLRASDVLIVNCRSDKDILNSMIARIDYRVRNNIAYCIDVNALPNLSPTRSFLPIIYVKCGKKYSDLICFLVEQAATRNNILFNK